jgi:hypothetical protein
MNILNKIFLMGLINTQLLFGASSSSSSHTKLAEGVNNLTADIGGMDGGIKKTLGLIAFVMGIVIMLWGLYDLFVDEDQQKQGKKVQGILRVLGGAAIILVGQIAGYLRGATNQQTGGGALGNNTIITKPNLFLASIDNNSLKINFKQNYSYI